MKILTFIALALIASIHFANAQGCSDAGVCTVPGLQAGSQHEPQDSVKNQFTFGVAGGRADHGISVVNAYAEYSRALFGDLGMSVRLTSAAYSGTQATTAGLSDVYLTAAYSGLESAVLTAGVKIPLSDGNLQKDGAALPMDYQMSLGTVDVIVGASFTIEDFSFALALQQPLTQNTNTFFADSGQFSEFHTTNNYVRKGDVMLRVSYPVFKSGAWRVTTGLLPIYHLGDDEFTDVNSERKTIEGSR
ncbi:MAG TPA: hypothetical protein VEC36_07685, partial [Patescibacteria group bacterium]|nr:hypothetical protein [Patescibacteria group bacterium]